ncbi:MAG: hypothetical protein PHR35_23375 [Kiritimatiellae bacterium]|nr:hypothetical protein [Kiritimatiellia bacterium]
MTLLQKMDAALCALCAAAAMWFWRVADPGMAGMWGASAAFCAASCLFGWADKLVLELRPLMVRLSLMRGLGGRR